MIELTRPINQLIPHSGTMSLLQEAIAATEETARAGLRIAEDSLLYRPDLGGVPSWVGIEYMAQTVAMFAGVEARRAGGQPAVGFLLGTRRYVANVPTFRLGAHLIVDVEQDFRDEQMAAFSCTIVDGTDCLAEARLNVFQPRDIESFLGMRSEA